MDLSEYKYEDLREKGFIKVKMKRSMHNRLLPNRKQKFGALIEYYYNPETNIVEAQYFCSWWYKILLIGVMFLPSILIQGLPDTIKDSGDLIHQRKRGRFSSDRWWLNSDHTSDGELEAFLAKVVEKQGGNLESNR